tara:strand:- start:82 stop:276 length:195 start_codon:yes stop_codon:yes gene_type:complete
MNNLDELIKNRKDKIDMPKTIKISNLVYEMLVYISEKGKPKMKADAKMELLIKQEYQKLTKGKL